MSFSRVNQSEEEVLISATNYFSEPDRVPIRSTAASYSMVLLRRVVAGKVETQLIVGEFQPKAYPKAAEEEWRFDAPNAYKAIATENDLPVRFEEEKGFTFCRLRRLIVCSCGSNTDARLQYMNELRTFATCCALLLSTAFSLTAGEHIHSKSPDGKFTLRTTFTELVPSHGDAAIIETATGKVAVQIHGDEPAGSEKLVWSKDSQRVASFRDDWQNGATKIFFRNGATFEEIKIPELPSPELPDLPKPDASDSETIKRVEPVRWLESGDLLLESELQNKAGARAALQITLGFEQGNQPMIRKSEKEKTSVLDYFLLLPSDMFEGPPYTWLDVMRANGEVIDKENGYMNCPGDGAQPEFEVALFRYGDGRPLLALCSGELEGTDSVQLRFFELGADGHMRQISSPILPGAQIKNDPGMGYVKEGWQFELPRKGRSILVRSEKTKKILHKFTWNGEKFQEEK